MSESLIDFAIELTARFPGCLFWETELRSRFGNEVDRLISIQLLRPVPTVPSKVLFPCKTKGACEAAGREIVETGGVLWAVCNCAAEEPPHRISLEALQQFRFCTDEFALAIAVNNSLRGRPSELDERVWFLGDSQTDGQNRAWVLALLRNDDAAVTSLESLLARLPSSYQTVVVLTAALDLPPDAIVRLNGLGVLVLRAPTDSEFQVSDELLTNFNARRGNDPSLWPDDYFKDEDGVWLSARILTERFAIPDSRLKEWREQGCPDLAGQKLVAKKIGGEGWVYFRMHVHQISSRRDDKGKVEGKLQIEARLESATEIKRKQSGQRRSGDSR